MSSSSSSSTTTTSWDALPNEIKLAVVDLLDTKQHDVLALSLVNQSCYSICLSARFSSIKLDNFNALQRFIQTVPHHYFTYIRHLHLCTKGAATTSPDHGIVAVAVNTLLFATTRLASLDLHIEGSLSNTTLPAFASSLKTLKTLSITGCGHEFTSPLSERFAVYIAASAPHLDDLTLDHITRSKMHAPELEGAYPCPPLVTNDSDIPDHPLFGQDLSLPSLLRIPSLRKLTIRDTHLGHDAWASVSVGCHLLQVLDLGSCFYETQHFNTQCTERIMSTLGPSTTIDQFSLATAVSNKQLFAKPSLTPLRSLRQLHITPYFPVEDVVETMANLAGSPVESVSVRCFEEDVVDVCASLEQFLVLRVEKGSDKFYDKLERIDVGIVASSNETTTTSSSSSREWMAPVKRLQELCRDLQLASRIARFDRMVQLQEEEMMKHEVPTKRPNRSMSI